MPDNFGSGKAANKAPTTSLHKGLSTRAPAAQDKSMSNKGGSVNDNATRSTTAKTLRSLGPRVA